MEIKLPQLPFLTREMLSFGNTAKLELEVVAYSNSSVAVSLIGMTREGIFKHDVSHAGDDTEDVLTFRISDIPIFVNIFTDSVFIERGDYYASVFLKINGERVAKLCSGYVTKQSGISYPITHDESEVPNGGLIRVIAVANPATGTDLVQAMGINKRWKLISLKATLTTSGQTANRNVFLKIGTNILNSAYQITCFTDQAQTAGQTEFYSFAAYPTLPTRKIASDILTSIPPNMPIISGGEVATETQLIQTGDNWTNIRLIVEEFIED